MPRQIFINLPVKDLKKTIDFFTKVGFTFNHKFTDKNATCMILGENLFAMLLVEKFFKTFIKKDIADAAKSAEAIVTLSVDSRQEVDDIVAKAVAAGATTSGDAQDEGWMYERGFQDLDGHLWEFVFMDESKMPAQAAS